MSLPLTEQGSHGYVSGAAKFVQITTTVAPQSPTLLYALDIAGDV
jgi:hypothetical protein